MLEFQPLPLAKVTRPLLHNKKMIKQSLCQLLPINKPVQKGGSLWTVLSVLLYLSWPISQRTLSQSGSTSTNHDKTKMSLYGNTATFFGAADRIRTCGLSGRSRTIYPAELQPHIYENRRWDEIHRMNFCESLGRNVHGGHFVVRPPRKSARHRIFKRRIAKNQQTMPPRHSCRSPTLYPAELRPQMIARRVLARTTIIIPCCLANCKVAGQIFSRSFPPPNRMGTQRGCRGIQIRPIQSVWRPSRRKTGMVASGAAAATVCPPAYTAPVCSSVQLAPAGR